MNWELFTAALSIGLVTALISLRHELTPLEAWALVVSRVLASGVMAWLLPEQQTGPALLALGVWEAGRVTAMLAAFFVYRGRAKREADRWLQRYQRPVKSPET